MPQLVDVPGMGTVEFPDDMNDEQIVSAIKSNSPDRVSKHAPSYPMGGTFAPTPEQMAAAKETIRGGDVKYDESFVNIPPLSGDEITATTGLPKAVTIPAAAAANLPIGIVNYFGSPQGVTEASVALTPAAPLVGLKWAKDMIVGAGETVADLAQRKLYEKMQQAVGVAPTEPVTAQELANAAVAVPAMLVGGAGAGLGSARSIRQTLPARPVVPPRVNRPVGLPAEEGAPVLPGGMPPPERKPTAMAALDDYFRNNPRGKRELENSIRAGDPGGVLYKQEARQLLQSALEQSPNDISGFLKKRAEGFSDTETYYAAIIRIAKPEVHEFQLSQVQLRNLHDWQDSVLTTEKQKPIIQVTRPPEIVRPPTPTAAELMDQEKAAQPQFVKPEDYVEPVTETITPPPGVVVKPRPEPITPKEVTPIEEAKKEVPVVSDEFSGGTRTLVHGGTGEFSKGKPVWFTENESDASWFAGERGGESPALVAADVTIKKPARLADVEAAAKTVGATAKDIEQHSGYKGENPLDFVYVPKVVAELKRRGFDGVIDSDVLENTSIMAYIPFDVSQIKETGRKIGQREGGFGDFVYKTIKPGQGVGPTETKAPAEATTTTPATAPALVSPKGYEVFELKDPTSENGKRYVIAGPEEYGIKLSAKQMGWKRVSKDLTKEEAIAEREKRNGAFPSLVDWAARKFGGRTVYASEIGPSFKKQYKAEKAKWDKEHQVSKSTPAPSPVEPTPAPAPTPAGTTKPAAEAKTTNEELLQQARKSIPENAEKAGAEKAPWEMPQSEFIKNHKEIDAAWQLDKSKPSTSTFGRFYGNDYQNYMDAGKFGGEIQTLSYEQLKHKSEVKQALREGKPVPAEVLEDYPELKAETSKGANLERALEIEKSFGLEPADAHFFNVAIEAVKDAPEKWTTMAEGVQKEAMRAATLAGGNYTKTGDLILAKKIAAKYIQAPKSTPPSEPPAKAVEKVKEQVATVAMTEGQPSAKAVKTELVRRLEEAAAKAISENDLTLAQRDALANAKSTDFAGLGNFQYGKQGDRLKAQARAAEEKKRTDAAIAAGLNQITFSIPGDGDFTIWNTKETITKVLDAARSLKTSPSEKIPLSKPRMDAAQYLKKDIEDALAVYGNEGNAYRKLSEQLNRASELELDSAQETRLRKLVNTLEENIQAPWKKTHERMMRVWGERDKEVGKGVQQNTQRLAELNKSISELKALEEAQNAEMLQKLGRESPSPEPVSMGGLNPNDPLERPSQMMPTANKNASIDADRIARGENPIIRAMRKTDPELWDEAMAAVDRDWGTADNIIADLKYMPRVPSDLELMILLHRRVDLKNEFAKASRDMALATEEGRTEMAQSAKAQRDAMLERLQDLESMLGRGDYAAGTMAGRALRARRLMMNEDFSLESLIVDRQASLGRKLTAEETVELEKIAADYKAKSDKLDARVAELERQAEEVQAQRIAEQAKRDAEQVKIHPSVLEYAEKFVSAMEKKADKYAKDLMGATWSPTPETLGKAAYIGAARLARGIVEMAKWTDEMVAVLGEKFRPYADEVRKKSEELLKAELTEVEKIPNAPKIREVIIKGKVEKASPEAIIKRLSERVKKAPKEMPDLQPMARKLAAYFYTQGIHEPMKIVDAVHAEFQRVFPNLERRETMDALSGYGRFSPLSKDALKVALRDVYGQLQQIGKLEDLQKKPPELHPTGPERRIPTDAERRLIQQVNEMKKAVNYNPPDTGKQLRSALQAAKTAVENQIKDLSFEIAKRERIVKSRTPLTPDKELLDLRARRDELRKQHAEIFPKPGLSESQKIKMAEAALDRQIETIKQQLETGAIFPEKKVPPTLTSPGIKAKALELEELKLRRYYERERIQPKNVPEQRIADALIAARKRMEEQIATLEKEIDTRQKIVKTKTKLVYDAKLTALKAKLDQLREIHREVFKAAPMTEAQRLALWKERITERIADLKERYYMADFKPRPKPIQPRLDKEAIKLRYELHKIHNALMDLRLKDQLAKRTQGRKIWDNFTNLIRFSRAMMTGGEFSGVLRQGGFIGAAHPIMAAKALAPMFKALMSEKNQFAINEEIHTRPNAPLYERSKLDFTESGVRLSTMEEHYQFRVSEKLAKIWGIKHGVAFLNAFQRAYTTFLNRIRADAFDKMVDTYGDDPVMTKQIANFINVATGRGSTGLGKYVGPGANAVFFAPRYSISRFQLLLGQPAWSGNAATRTMVVKEYGRALAGAATVYTLGVVAGGTLEEDPRSADFGKIKFGNTRIDPLAGLAQVTRLLATEATGKRMNQQGKLVPVRGDKVPYGQPSGWDVAAQFTRQKLSPAVGAAASFATGKDPTGMPFKLSDAMIQGFTPITYGDVLKAMQEQGVPRGTAMAVLAIFGMGVQTYEPRQPKTKSGFSMKLGGL